jgi:arabinofuranosyltransferase
VTIESETSVHARTAYLPVAIALCVFTVVVLRCAWLSDDAYITFRTVENFVDGYGLRWNVDERVQTYTHPLWMLVLSGIYWLTREFYYSAILLSALLSIATVVLFAARVAVAAIPALIGVATFTLSKAFMDYSASGLENPLTHLLLMLFLLVYLVRPPDRRTLFWLCLLAGLLTLNRLDIGLLVLPALCVVFYRCRGWSALGLTVLGFVPLLAWELFALLYYGSFFPNTAYAKLNSGIPAGELIGQGLRYLLITLEQDPLTIVIIGAGLATPIVVRQRDLLPASIGILLYLLYVIWIGGDFMLGRFLAAPLLIAVVLLTRAPLSARTGLTILILIALVGLVPARSPFTSGEDYGYKINYVDQYGICDERAYYYHGTGLLRATHNVELPTHSEVVQGRAIRDSGERVAVLKTIGMQGFFAGRQVHVVDEMALADPLLARMKPDLSDGWRIGHLRREIPEGYVQTLETDRNCLTDPNLAAYYDKIALITRGRLFDPQRLLGIVKLNLGSYDDLLAAAHP